MQENQQTLEDDKKLNESNEENNEDYYNKNELNSKELNENLNNIKDNVNKEECVESPARDERIKKIAQTLIKLYKFVNNNEEFDEFQLVSDLEQNTPNETLRQELYQKQLEIEMLIEETQVLKQSALQAQLEWESQREFAENERQSLKARLKVSEQAYKTKMDEITKSYSEKIKELKKQLREIQRQNELTMEVNEAIPILQDQISQLTDKNDKLTDKVYTLNKEIDEKESMINELKEQIEVLEKTNKELSKKTELQQMVIDGYKRKEKEAIEESRRQKLKQLVR